MKKKFVFFIVLVLLITTLMTVHAGSVIDYGQLQTLPADGTINYVAWLDTAGTPPSQVITEDSYNSGNGTNGGYENQYWLLGVGAFGSPAAANGDTVNVIFGGINAEAGHIWSTNFSWENANALTDQGIIPGPSVGYCPAMLGGSQDGTGKTVNWSGTATNWLIYRSQNGSGAVPANDASNGIYNYVATVAGGTTTYLDTTCATGTDCWHIVVPTDGSGNIVGCHSEETNPTAINLSTINLTNSVQNTSFMVIVVGSFLVLLVVSYVILKKGSCWITRIRAKG